MTDIQITTDITVTPIQHVGGDAMVVAAAKVSTNPDEALQWALEEYADDSKGLINYLMKHRHGSPFEHGQLTVFADVPIFVWREWHRHRVWSFNEQSARYSEMTPKFWVPRFGRRIIKAEGYKAARPKFEPTHDSHHKLIVERMVDTYRNAWYNYEYMMKSNIAPEVARAVIPTGVYSKGWATVNSRNVMSFLSLRTHDESAQFVSYPQAEIEEAARQVEEFFADNWPITYEAFVKNGRVGP